MFAASREKSDNNLGFTVSPSPPSLWDICCFGSRVPWGPDLHADQTLDDTVAGRTRETWSDLMPRTMGGTGHRVGERKEKDEGEKRNG